MKQSTIITEHGFILFDMNEDVFIVNNCSNLMVSSQRESLEAVFAYMRVNNLRCLSELYYCDESSMAGFDSLRTEVLEHLRMSGGTHALIQGKPLNGQDICGYVLHAAKPGPDTTIEVFKQDGIAIRRNNHRGRELHLYGVHGTVPGICRSVEEQTASIFKKVNCALESAEMITTDIARTYFYLRDIKRDYEEFNSARTEYFNKALPNRHPFPASTGIHGNSMWKDKVVLNFTALSGFDISDIHTTRQCSPCDYGKLFSRGKIVTSPGQRRAYVSGTASIDKYGNTVFSGDHEKQICQTLECVAELLRNAGLKTRDIRWASLYFKASETAKLYDRIVKGTEFEIIPGIPMLADICRDDLLFEMDLFAQSE